MTTAFATNPVSEKIKGNITVAIVEDTQEIREGLVYLIQQSPGFNCVAAYGSAEDALEFLPNQRPDVVLMDIGLPGMSGIECIKILKSRLPSCQIMMLTVFEDHDRIFDSLSAGATGYLVKKTAPTKILEAIRDLHEGGSPMSNQIARRVVQNLQGIPKQCPESEGLTPRQKQILQYLAQGFLYKEVADQLGLSVETVRTHIRNIYEKLQVHTRTDAINKVFSPLNFGS